MSGAEKLSEEHAISGAAVTDINWGVGNLHVVPNHQTNRQSARKNVAVTGPSISDDKRVDECSKIRVKQVSDYQRVFFEYAPFVLRVLPRLGVPTSDVEDVCQEVFLAVHRKLPGFEGRSSLRTWLYGICLRTASNYRQRAYRWREVVTDRPPETVQSDEQIETLRQKEIRDLLDEALNILKDSEREVVVLFEIEELDMAEVARAIGCSKFTAYARLYAARKQMKSFIRRRNAVRRAP